MKCPNCGKTLQQKVIPPGMKLCSKCKETKPLSEFHKLRKAKDGLKPCCKVCNTGQRLEYPRLDANDYINRATGELQEHISALVAMPLITDKEWLDTCRYFRKCALCAEKEITSKHYFVSFMDGGKSSKNNIIPLCSACAEFCRKEISNMFYLRHKRIRRRYQDGKFKENRNVEKMIKYLQEVNDEARRRL